ncbi:MAG: hypothetical protein IJ815_02040 [Lachnospiraceae bacterium]|nr:hypothetical protein [Lachnospiraceae bacterium]
MNAETEQFIKRIKELSETSYTNSQYLFTDFLSEAEISDILSIAGNASDAISKGETIICNAYPSGITLYGGHAEATRRIARFGSMEAFAYEEVFPIKIIHIEPRLAKFADTFTHRDFLGAILNLGIDRKVTGDILTDGTEAYLFCDEKIADFILDNLDKVKHTHIKCSIAETVPSSMAPHMESFEYQVSSERIDGIVSQVTKISRSKSLELFRTGKVFVNGRQMENPSFTPKSGDMISIRGYGKMRYAGVNRTTKKGKLNISVERFI